MQGYPRNQMEPDGTGKEPPGNWKESAGTGLWNLNLIDTGPDFMRNVADKLESRPEESRNEPK